MALSRDLADYLVGKVRVAPANITQVYNGVDTERFCPASVDAPFEATGLPGSASGGHGPRPIAGCPFDPSKHWLVGTVGRMQAVKDQVMLARAFVHALELAPQLRATMRLVMVGEGPLRAQAQAVLDAAGASALAWLPGERGDVADIMRGLHAFALPSLAEGISNTILEAMASGLPVIATDVGGNADLVVSGQTGEIIAAGDPLAMALRLVQLASDPQRARAMGLAGRQRAQAEFSMQAMVRNYQSVYDTQLARARAR